MAQNPNPSQLDAHQITKREFDDANDAMRVNIVASTSAGNTVDITSGDGSGDKANVTPNHELEVFSTAQPGVDIGDVTVNNASGASAVNIQDGGNSITVDGAVVVSATNLDIRDLTSVSDSVNANIQVGDVDVSNSNPVPISDAGESITIDGIVASTQSGTWNITDVSGTISLPTGASTSANQTTGNTSLASIDANIGSRLSGSLVPAAFDEIALTYVPSGNGAGQVATATYKLATVAIKTLTLSYDSSNRLTDVIAS